MTINKKGFLESLKTVENVIYYNGYSNVSVNYIDKYNYFLVVIEDVDNKTITSYEYDNNDDFDIIEILTKIFTNAGQTIEWI